MLWDDHHYVGVLHDWRMVLQLVNVAVVISQRRAFGGCIAAYLALERLHACVHLLVVIETSPLGEGLITEIALVRLVSCMYPSVSLQG